MGVAEVRHGLVGLGLHPLAQGVGAVDLVGGVGVQNGHGLGDAGPGPDALGRLVLQLDDASELLLAPFVGLGEVDRRSQEGT